MGKAGIDVGIPNLAHVRQYRCLYGVIQEDVADSVVKGRAIVWTWMTKTESMANLMKIDIERIAIYCISILGKCVSRDVDNRRYNDLITDCTI